MIVETNFTFAVTVRYYIGARVSRAGQNGNRVVRIHP
jgi:hypothetical protein